MGYPLSGKTALVTGANRGIGEAIVDALVAAGVKKLYAAARTISMLDPLGPFHRTGGPGVLVLEGTEDPVPGTMTDQRMSMDKRRLVA